MSTLMMLLRRFLARRPPSSPAADPEQMGLREWADLPAWHPRCDHTPC